MTGPAADHPTHPRDGCELRGVEAPTRAFLDALSRGRLHHAWLLTGPQGMGKASFAYQAARRLLGARPHATSDLLGCAPDDPVARLVSARSHPDLLVLERVGEDGAARKSIPVDEARRVSAFFSKAPAIAPYRVAIIDAADDLNANAANAVLKTLEEPSGHGVLFLVSHAPGQLLATLRSRCRRLGFAPWSQQSLADFAVERLGVETQDAVRLAGMAKGAPGRVLTLAGSEILALDARVAAILSALPDIEETACLTLADGFRGGEGAQRFALTLDRLADRLQAAITASALAGEGGGGTAQRWGGAWERLAATPAQVEALNLDRADAFWTLIADLRARARTHPISPAVWTA